MISSGKRSMAHTFTALLSIAAGILWLFVTLFGFMDSTSLFWILGLSVLPILTGFVFFIWSFAPLFGRSNPPRKISLAIYALSWGIAIASHVWFAQEIKKDSIAAMSAECACDPDIQRRQECNPPGKSIVVLKSHSGIIADCIDLYKRKFSYETYVSPPPPQTTRSPIQTSVGAWCGCSKWAQINSPFCKDSESEKAGMIVQPLSEPEAYCILENSPLSIPWRSVSRKDHCTCIAELRNDSYCSGKRDMFEAPVYLTKTQKACLKSKIQK